MSVSQVAPAPSPAAVATDAPSAEVPLWPIWRLSVEKYQRMVREGIITDDDPVELLEGWLVQKMGKNPPHRVATGLLQDALTAAVPAGWHVCVQEPVTTSDSEPEPDLSVARGARRDYLDRHPGPEDVALHVEVSDASLKIDRRLKKRVYGRARIPCYWIVNLVDRRIEVYTDPTGPESNPDYRQRRDYGPSESVPLIIEGREAGQVAVDDVLP